MNFEEIYHEHKTLVFNLSLQYVQNTEDAEEITQDVFVNIHQSYHTFNQKSSLKTWIYRITINKSIDFIKAKNRKKRFHFITSLFFEDGSDLKHDSPTFNHPGVLLEQKEASIALFNHINQLADKQKTALILNKIEGKTVTETADIMGVSYKAAESLIQRAKNNLAKKINPNEGNKL